MYTYTTKTYICNEYYIQVVTKQKTAHEISNNFLK